MARPPWISRAAVTVAVAVLAVAATAASPTVARAATAPGATAADRSPDWQRCGHRLQCATLDLPVDYDDPTGATFSMAVIRSLAPDRAHRLGTLVVNYGGPGDAGALTLRVARNQIPAAVRGRFDLVSFDPRGTGASRGIDCIDDATTEALVAEDPTPDDAAELERFYTGANSAVDVDAACIARYGEWLSAVGTRNVARDMEELRVALGERRIDFLGFSYGTVLGAVYAQMYPEHVRRMVLDGAVDLSATRAEDRIGNIDGFERALGDFLDWCAGDTACPFHGNGDPRTALEHLRDRFEGGLMLPVSDGRRAGATALYLGLIGSLYDRSSGWRALAVGLRDAAKGDGTVLQVLADVFLGRDRTGHYDDLQEAIGFITCADVPIVRESFRDYRAAFDDAVRRAPFLGRVVASSPIGCDPRVAAPAADAVLGDVRVDDAPPALIVGATRDPATPYTGALDLAQRMHGSRVLTYESTEHAAYGRGVRCIDDAVNRYLLRGRLPAAGTRCRA